MASRLGGSGRASVDRRALGIFVAVVAVLLAGTVAFFTLKAGGPAGGGRSVVYPPSLAGMTLVDQKNGLDALADVKSLHGLDFALVDGEVATYTGSGNNGSQKAIIWVARAPGATDAERLLIQMRDKMTDNPTVFSKPQAFQVRDTVYYYSRGAGMTNYFYQLGDRVVWVGLAGVDEAGVLEEIVRTIREIYLFQGGH